MIKFSSEECTDLDTGNQSLYKFRNAKQCAIIAVEDIVSYFTKIQFDYHEGYFDSDIAYFNQVKTEIENL